MPCLIFCTAYTRSQLWRAQRSLGTIAQYIPWIKHTDRALLYSAVVIITSLALGQSHYCPIASEAILKNMGSSITWTTIRCSLHMMTSSNGKIFALLAICAGNWPVTGEFPAQGPVTRSFDVFIDLRPNKRLSKESWGWIRGAIAPIMTSL